MWQQPVTYGAVGATQAHDLLNHPPAGYRATERRRRIGHGEARWRFAWLQTMTWGVKKRSGFRVRPVDAPAEVLDNTYIPVVFDRDGTPVAPAATALDQVFGADGSQLVRPGDSAVLLLGWGRLSLREPVRVVYIVDEPQRRGFAYGTLPGHPLRGEESFMVERRADDSVWITIRAFSRPSSRLWWALYPAVRLAQEFYTRRYLRALAGPLA